jgi:hypothetical protein
MIETIKKTEKYSSWILEMPSEIAKQEGFSQGAKVLLTFENGKIQSEIISPTPEETKREVSRIIGKYDDIFREPATLDD